MFRSEPLIDYSPLPPLSFVLELSCWARDVSCAGRSSSSTSGTNSSKSGASDGLYGGSIYSDGACGSTQTLILTYLGYSRPWAPSTGAWTWDGCGNTVHIDTVLSRHRRM